MLIGRPGARKGPGRFYFTTVFALLQSLASEAQRQFATMGGAATPTSANFTLAGTDYQGVLNEVSTQVPATATGFEIIRELQIVAERTQFAAKPDASARPTITALGATWYLTNVGESPLHYMLTARPG